MLEVTVIVVWSLLETAFQLVGDKVSVFVGLWLTSMVLVNPPALTVIVPDRMSLVGLGEVVAVKF